MSTLAEQAGAHGTQVFAHDLLGVVRVVGADGVHQPVVLVVGFAARPCHGGVDCFDAQVEVDAHLCPHGVI